MIEVELPDGTVLEFPAGTPDSVVQRAARRQMGLEQQRPQSRAGEMLTATMSNLREAFPASALRDVAAGAVRGAGSIGATLMQPVDAAARAMGIENSVIGRRDRREAMTEGLRSMGANPESVPFAVGKIGTEIAGTLGTGGALGSVAGMARAPSVLRQALASSGMSSGGLQGAGGLLTRTLGGAATGGTAAALVNPDEAATGALIGGALPGAMAAGRVGASRIADMLGVTTGAGRESVQTAFQAGQSGGARGKAFTGQLRGQEDMLQVLDDARANVAQLRAQRAAEYRANMAPVSQDRTILDMTPIQQSIRNAQSSFTYKGQAKNPAVIDALSKVDEAVTNWRQLNPSDFHTPEGLDALKQQIGAIRDNLANEARAPRAALDGVYNAIKREIEKQAPDYAKAMRDYQQASELIDEVTRTFSLKDIPKATADTAMRKLQSVMRNNVNTNYGVRSNLMDQLEQQGGRELRPALAGQALSDWAPRGLSRATMPAGMVGLGYFGGNIPGAIGMAAMSSPRLVGEAAYAAGQSSRYVEPLRKGLYYTAPVLGAQ